MTKRQSGFSLAEAVIGLFFVGIVAFVALRVYSLNKASNAITNSMSLTSVSKTPLPDGWGWYENNQYGFKVAYPLDWGKPEFEYIKGQDGGSSYYLNFRVGGQFTVPGTLSVYPQRITVTLQMDSEDYMIASCHNDCADNPALYQTPNTKQQYLDIIKTVSSNDEIKQQRYVTEYGKQHYVSESPGKSSATLYMVISLPKLNISAGMARYVTFDTEGPESACNSNGQSNRAANSCVNQEVISKLKHMMLSIKQIE